MVNFRTLIKDSWSEVFWYFSSSKPSEDEQKKIEQLRGGIMALPPLNLTEATSRAETAWLLNRQELRENILHRDPRNFLNWPVIKRTMFNEAGIDKFTAIKESANWPVWQAVIKEDKVGNPPPYSAYSKSSGNLINHLYSTAQFTGDTGIALEKLGTIFEFGGGYGSLARLITNLGFNGQYIIFDLPEFSLLQGYYLSSVFPEIPVHTSPTKEAGFVLLSDFRQLADQLKLVAIDCFIALWSLSESPLEIREQILPLIGESTDWFIGYQEKFKSIDNVSYFKELSSAHQNTTWQTKLVPNMGTNHYLFGVKKGN